MLTVITLVFDSCAQTPHPEELIDAITKGNLEKVQQLIQKGVDVNAKTSDGYTALMVVSKMGNEEIINAVREDLMKRKEGVMNITELVTASRNKYKQIAELLLKNGADVNAKTNAGETALYLSSKHCTMQIAELLLKNGADINAKTNTGETPLYIASQALTFVAKETVELLLKNGADVNAKTNTGETALYAASKNDRTDIVALLLENNADINTLVIDVDQPRPEFVPYDTPPQLVKSVDPVYPFLARNAGLEGEVLVKAWADKNGKVRKAIVVKSVSDILNGPAIDAAMQFLFTPAQKGQKPVDAWVSIPIEFKLK